MLGNQFGGVADLKWKLFRCTAQEPNKLGVRFINPRARRTHITTFFISVPLGTTANDWHTGRVAADCHLPNHKFGFDWEAVRGQYIAASVSSLLA